MNRGDRLYVRIPAETLARLEALPGWQDRHMSVKLLSIVEVALNFAETYDAEPGDRLKAFFEAQFLKEFGITKERQEVDMCEEVA